MNAFLLSLAIALALALGAAFGVPWVIDWNAHRPYFEEQIAEIIGRPVTIDGDIDVRIAPFPTLDATDVRIGGEGSDEGVAALSIRGGLMPLLSGEIHVTEVTIDRPRLRVSVSPEGFVSWGMETEPVAIPVSPEKVRIDRFEVNDGQLVVEDARSGEDYVADGLDVWGSAASLAGPFRLEGTGRVGDRSLAARIALGRVQPDGGVRVGATLRPTDGAATLILDGDIAHVDGQPRYEGLLRVEAAPAAGQADAAETAATPAAPAWRLEARTRATPAEIVLEELGLRVGSDDHPMTMSGAATLDLGREPRFEAVMSSRQVDLDRALGGGPEAPVPPHAAVAALGELVSPGILPVGGRLSLDIASIVVGGDIVENLAADLVFEPRSMRIASADATLPGRTSVALSGEVATSAEGAASFEGAVNLAARSAGPLATWLFRQEALLPGFGSVAGDLDASASVSIGPNGFGLERLEIETERNRLTGSVAYTAPAEEGGGGLALALNADELDLRGLPVARLVSAIAQRVEEGEALALDLDLDAGLVVGGPVEARQVRAQARLAGDTLTIETLRIGRLAGLGLDGEGEFRLPADNPLMGRAQLGVKVDDAAAAAQALRDLGQADLAAAIEARAGALAPGRLTLALAAEPGSGVSVDLDGSLAGTAVQGTLAAAGPLGEAADGGLTVSLTGRNPEGGRILALLGLPESGGAGPGRFAFEAEGRPREGLDFQLSGRTPALVGTVDGTAAWPDTGARRIDAKLTLDLHDAPGLTGRSLGRLAALAGNGRLIATLDADGRKYAFPEFSYAGDARLSGSLTIEPGDASAVTGTLTVSELDLRELVRRAAGVDAFLDSAGDGEAEWSGKPFDQLDPGGWTLALALDAPRAQWDGLDLRDLSLSLSADERGFALRDVAAGLWNGEVAGDLELQTLRGVLNASLRLQLDDVPAQRLVWEREGKPVATGPASLSLELAGSGRSPSALVGSLGGEGSFSVGRGIMRSLSPKAFAAVVAKMDEGLDVADAEVADLLAAELDAGRLVFDEIAGAITASAGVLRINRVPVETKELAAFLSGTLDLSALAIDGELDLRASEAEDGRAQEATVHFSGPLAAPERSIDADPLVSYLTVRQFEREMRRLEELQDEILERERLGRELLQLGRERRKRERAAEPPEAPASPPEAAAPATQSSDTGQGEPITLDREEFRRTIRDLLRDVPGGGRSMVQPAPRGT